MDQWQCGKSKWGSHGEWIPLYITYLKWKPRKYKWISAITREVVDALQGYLDLGGEGVGEDAAVGIYTYYYNILLDAVAP